MLYILAAGVLLLAAQNFIERRRHDATLARVAAENTDRVAELHAAHADRVASLMADAAAERREALEHMERLYQRIQAPQAAVVEHHAQIAGPSYPAVAIDDDEGFYAAQQVSKERLAELALEQEIRDRAPDLTPAG